MSNALFDPSRFSYGPVLIGVAFWIFLAIVVLAAIWLAFARNRETQKTIRLAIEKGMQLDAVLIDKLVTRKTAKPEDYYIGGFVCIAVGIGLPIMGFFISRIEPDAFFPIVGPGILVGLIGISLIACGILVGRRGRLCSGSLPPSMAKASYAAGARSLRRMAETDRSQCISPTHPPRRLCNPGFRRGGIVLSG